MNVRTLQSSDLDQAGTVLFGAFASAAELRGYRPPWPDEQRARALLSSYRDAEREHVLVAEEGGVVIGVGALRVRGEIASVGPIAVMVDGRGIGSALLDGLLACADRAGVVATRLYVDAWNPSAYALYAGRGFGVVDLVTHIERQPGNTPELGNSRGLEVRPFERSNATVLEELVRFDRKLTGHDRPADLAASVRLVARRRGSIVGYLGAVPNGERTSLGPAVAVDVSDLFILLTNALIAAASDESWIGGERVLHARLSTSAPAASMAAMGLGFKVCELGVVMSHGAPPPTRPPQMYALLPELL